jgi:hypothetical protein
MTQFRRPWTRQPPRLCPAPGWDIAWLGSDPTAQGWVRSESPTTRADPHGTSSQFTGSTSQAYSRGGVPTAAKTEITFLAVLNWNGDTSGTNGVIATSSINSGFIFYISNGITQLTKGGIANLLGYQTLTAGIPYVLLVTHSQVTGLVRYYTKPIWYGAPVVSGAGWDDSSASTGGDGIGMVGHFRPVDLVRSFGGSIYMAAAAFRYTEPTDAMRLLYNPWQIFEPRTIMVPDAAAGAAFKAAWARQRSSVIGAGRR